MAEGGSNLPWNMSQKKPGTALMSLAKTKTGQKKSRFQKEKEEREAKKKQNEAEAAKVYEQFVASFDADDDDTKTFVRGDTYVPKGAEKTGGAPPTSSSGSVYKLKSRKEPSEIERMMMEGGGGDGGGGSSKAFVDKKKGNRQIDAFLEEIKNKQEGKGPIKLYEDPAVDKKGSYDDGDPASTNLYIGNIAPTVTEELLQETFGRYGEIYSVKIMWPRTEEERARQRNCGFVSFYRRSDAEDAKVQLHDSELDGYKMVIGWGKAVKRLNNLDSSTIVADVPVPDGPTDLELPPTLKLKQQLKALQQKKREEEEAAAAAKEKEEREAKEKERERDHHHQKEKGGEGDGNESSSKDASDDRRSGRKWDQAPAPEPAEREPGENDPKIIITFPSDPNVEFLISRTARYVAKDGAGIEMKIKEREGSNPAFRFLFDYDTPEGNFYRWRVYSMLMGDKDYKWRMKPFQMTPDGPFWMPPEVPAAWKEEEEDREREKERRRERGRSRERERERRERSRERDDRQRDQDRARDREEREKEREAAKYMTGRQLELAREKARGRDTGNRLSTDDYDEFMEMLRNINRSRQKIKEAMGFAFDNCDASEEVVDLLKESLTVNETAIPVKLARLYVVSDILHNSSSAVRNASTYRTYLQAALPYIFEGFNAVIRSGVVGRFTAQNLEEKVLSVLQVWENWSIYPPLYITGLEATFRRKATDLEDIPEADEAELEKEKDALLRQAKQAGLSTEGSLLDVVKRIRYLDRYIKLKASGMLPPRARSGSETERGNHPDMSIYGPQSGGGGGGGRNDHDGFPLPMAPPPAPPRRELPMAPPPPPASSSRSSSSARGKGLWSTVTEEDGDGSDDEDVDGVPLDALGPKPKPRPMMPKSRFDTDSDDSDDDVDGRPLDASVFAPPPPPSSSIGHKRSRTSSSDSDDSDNDMHVQPSIGDAFNTTSEEEGGIKRTTSGGSGHVWTTEEEEERRSMLRTLETRLLLLRDELEAKGVGAEEIEKKVGEKRTKTVTAWEDKTIARRKKKKGKSSSSNGVDNEDGGDDDGSNSSSGRRKRSRSRSQEKGGGGHHHKRRAEGGRSRSRSR